MSITGNDLTAFQGRPHVLTNGFIRRIFADVALHLTEPNKDFLVCKAVKRTGKTVQGGAKRQEGIRESRSNEFSGVGRDVSSFVVTRARISTRDSRR